ncbi:MAG: Uma2 family endonuclease [Kofleriaceae bacterium]
MYDPTKRNATYQDVLDAPDHLTAELLDGDLYLSPRPGGPHASVASTLGYLLGPPFQLGAGGPGGWIILAEPAPHLRPETRRVAPHLAGWRRVRMPEVTGTAYFTIVPDWICEVLSPSNAIHDRSKKLPLYAASGVAHLWLVDPLQRSVEVMRLHEGKWLLLDVHQGDGRVRAEPFDMIELDLALLWAVLPKPQPTRASEIAAEYRALAAK